MFFKWRHSVFLKLMFIFLATGIAVNTLFYLTGRFFNPLSRREFIDRNLYLYLSRVTDEIGNPPSQASLDRIAAETGLAVRADTTNRTLVTEVGLADPFPSMPPHIKMNENVRINNSPRPYFIIRRQDAVFTFYGPSSEWYYGRPEPIYLALAIVSVVLIISYISLRRILGPIRAMREVVQQVAEGNFDRTMKVTGDDELAELARTFNDMAARIQSMIHAKERLLSDVSHELRSPITRMKLAVKLIDDPRGKERLNRDLGSMERLVTIVLDAAHFANRGRELKIETFDLITVIQECMQDCRDNGPGIQAVSLPDSALIVADRLSIYTVIKNLLDNALKYSLQQSTAVEIRCREQDESYLIAIRDYGIGISREHVGKIFEPFYRVDPSRSKDSGGFGLGLNLCQRIMDSHKGTITVVSQPVLEIGTEVTVHLPKKYT